MTGPEGRVAGVAPAPPAPPSDVGRKGTAMHALPDHRRARALVAAAGVVLAVLAGSLTATTAEAAQPTIVRVHVLRSSDEVYPVVDGFEDSVRFRVLGADTVGAAVAVSGTAALTHAGRIVRTWDLDGSTTVLTWDGRVHGAVRPGSYSLAVTAWSSDGSTVRSVSMVRVIGKRVVRKQLTVRTPLHGTVAVDAVPRNLLKAYAIGDVLLRLRTAATVHGTARLIVRGPGGSRIIALRNGVHTTAAIPVPLGFVPVTVEYEELAGRSSLRSLTSVWSYPTLR